MNPVNLPIGTAPKERLAYQRGLYASAKGAHCPRPWLPPCRSCRKPAAFVCDFAQRAAILVREDLHELGAVLRPMLEDALCLCATGVARVLVQARTDNGFVGLPQVPQVGRNFSFLLPCG